MVLRSPRLPAQSCHPGTQPESGCRCLLRSWDYTFEALSQGGAAWTLLLSPSLTPVWQGTPLVLGSVRGRKAWCGGVLVLVGPVIAPAGLCHLYLSSRQGRGREGSLVLVHGPYWPEARIYGMGQDSAASELTEGSHNVAVGHQTVPQLPGCVPYMLRKESVTLGGSGSVGTMSGGLMGKAVPSGFGDPRLQGTWGSPRAWLLPCEAPAEHWAGTQG